MRKRNQMLRVLRGKAQQVCLIMRPDCVWRRLDSSGGTKMDKPDRVYAALEAWALAKAVAFKANPTAEALDDWIEAQDVLKAAAELLYPENSGGFAKPHSLRNQPFL
jgi:hypothetical protein